MNPQEWPKNPTNSIHSQITARIKAIRENLNALKVGAESHSDSQADGITIGILERELATLEVMEKLDFTPDQYAAIKSALDEALFIQTQLKEFQTHPFRSKAEKDKMLETDLAKLEANVRKIEKLLNGQDQISSK